MPHAEDIVADYFESEDWAALADDAEADPELESPPDADAAAA